MLRLPPTFLRSFHPAAVAGIAVAILASVVLAGWWIRSLALVQVLPGASAMRFNTALCLFGLGVALTALSFRRHRLPRYLGVGIALAAALTVSQDIFSVNLGIDEFFVSDWSGVGPNPSGRMAVNTAICLILSGISVAVLGVGDYRRGHALLVSFCASIVFAVGMVSVVGYLWEIDFAYGWGGSLGMAIHTAAALTLVGAALIKLAVKGEYVHTTSLPNWLPLPVAFAGLTASIVLWQALRQEHLKAVRRLAELQAVPHSADHVSRLPEIVLICGSFVAIALAAAIYFAQRASERSRVAGESLSALQRTQTRFRAVFDQTFQFIGLLSPDGRLLEANRTALAFAGSDAADVLGKPFWETPWWSHSPELQARLRGAVAAAAAGQFQRFEATHPGPDGRIHYVDFSMKPVYDDQGRVVYLLPEGRDVTDRRTAEVALQESHRELSEARTAAMSLADELRKRNLELDRERVKAEAANRMKSEFLANMSHELRTPLTAILGFTDLLREQHDPPAKPARDERHLQTIQSAGKHLLTLINDILDLSKIEANKMDVERVEVALIDVLRDVEDMMRCRAVEKNLSLEVTLATPLPEHVYGDPTRLRQILVNLIGNAVKFTETGGVRVTASVESRGRRERLLIHVEDTGPGMTPEQASVLFEPFGQADASVTRKHGGSGLGLSICRRLAQLLDGTVTLIRTAPNHGTCFRVDLPLERVPNSATTSRIESPKPTPPSVSPEASVGLDGRVLLAEDGRDNQRLIEHYLRKAGAEVDVADNGRVALEMLDRAARQGSSYGLLLTDMQMPEMDGYSLARTLRDRGDRLPIVALTAHAMADDRRKCLEAGCDDYVAKPIDRLALLSTCRKWLVCESGERPPVVTRSTCSS